MKTIKEHLWNLDNFINWLETKDPKDTYRYDSVCDCLLSQYMQAQGFPLAEHFGMNHYSLTGSVNDVRTDMPMVFREIAAGVPAEQMAGAPCTFGEALDRARRARAGAYQTA